MSKEQPGNQRLVLRNMLVLVGAQLAGTPLSILVNALIGRYLGADAFGKNFLAWTLTLFGFLIVEWGHGNVITAAVARDRSRAGELLGTTVAWRLTVAVVVHLALALVCWLLGYGTDFQVVLALVVLQCVLGTITGAFQDVVRGFERTDVTALGQVGTQALTALVVIPTLMFGGKLQAVLVAQAGAQAIVLCFVWRAARRIDRTPVSVRRDTVLHLVRQGAPFLAYGLAMALQSSVDAVFLSKLAPAEVVGWQAAARRLAGVLLMPAGALVGALYPTLARLHASDPSEYRETLRSSLRATLMLAVPVALCCALYRDVGVRIFSEDAFEPARDNLLIYAVFLFILYVSMPLGSAILAAGRARQWALVQLLCVVTSFVLDPLLIPWFQRRYGNGGLGVCAALVISELWMVSAAAYLVPRGVFNRAVFVALVRVLGAGLVMASAGFALRAVTPFVAAPLSFASYLVALWALGGIDPREVRAVRNLVSGKLRRA